MTDNLACWYHMIHKRKSAAIASLIVIFVTYHLGIHNLSIASSSSLQLSDKLSLMQTSYLPTDTRDKKVTDLAPYGDFYVPSIIVTEVITPLEKLVTPLYLVGTTYTRTSRGLYHRPFYFCVTTEVRQPSFQGHQASMSEPHPSKELTMA